MAAPKETLWSRDGHTEGKHLVLAEYLKAWFPILGMGNAHSRIVFVDGFAGPGEYADGEEGSPVVAMRVLAEHAATERIKAEVVFVFVEERPDRAKHLQGLVDQWCVKLPSRSEIQVLPDAFETVMHGVREDLKASKARMAPALVMADPFGVKGIPLEVFRGILDNEGCEVYVSFMWEGMNRFLVAPEFEDSLDEMFGTVDWRQAKDLDGDERRSYLYNLYRTQLKEAGANHVIHFHLYKGNRLKYSVFFATGHSLGSDRMKRAIWKVAPFGDFSFKGGESDQLVMLGVAEPDFTVLADALHCRFHDAGWVSMSDVVEFVRSDATIFHEGHLRRQLKSMEKEGRLDVDPTRTRRFSYPDGSRVRFVLPTPSLFGPEGLP